MVNEELESFMLGVVFGAGSVGRGFIGELFFDSNIEICFVDVAEDIIKSMNEKHSYKHLTVYNEEEKKKIITGVSAINSLDKKAVIETVKEADIIATSLGANVLPIIAPVLAEALLHRMDTTGKKINILLCENLHNVDIFMRDLLLKNTPSSRHSALLDHVGLLSTSIGRMIPVLPDEIRKTDPTEIIVEPYKFLPFNGAAIKGDFPDVENLIWDKDVDFSFYSDRKLYVHNMGHSTTAYLAEYLDYEYIWEAIYDSKIRYFVRSAMIESAMALSKKYKQDLSKIINHIDNLLMRFANQATGDTCDRVGRDPIRKLKADDRFLGALKLCVDQDMFCPHLSLGVAAGLLKLEKTPEFGFDDIRSYLSQEAPWIFDNQYIDTIKLLEQQIDALRDGFSFEEQIDLLNSASPKRIP